jgi:hypothetical protein
MSLYLRWEKDTVMHARLARLPSSSHLRSAITTTPLRALAVCKYHAIHREQGMSKMQPATRGPDVSTLSACIDSGTGAPSEVIQ